MARCALLVTGQPRTFEFCFPSLKTHLIDKYSPDVFISTDEKEKEIRELYKPIMIDVRSNDEVLSAAIEMREGFSSVLPDAVISSGWKAWKAIQLMSEYQSKSDFIYDIVFLTRFDVKFLYIQNVISVRERTMYVPIKGGYHIVPKDKPGIHWHGYSTHLYWMSPWTANKLSEMYFFPPDYVQLATDAIPTNGNNPEHVLKYFCQKNNIAVRFVNIEMMLIRGTSTHPLSFHNHSLTEFPEYL